MLDKYLNGLSSESQGMLALAMGLVLVLGSLGKLGILQGVLNTIMIGVGVVLLMWGFDKSKGMNKVKSLLKKK